jgi:hypothetical protein
MKFLGAVIVALGLAAGPAFAADAPATPDAVVTEMYQTYYDALNAADAAGSTDNMPDCVSQTAKYATPELAARLAKTDSTGEMVIDWDFLVNGQDFKNLKLISAKVTAETADSATVRVESQNFDAKSNTDVLLTKTAEGWKISNLIFWPGEKETTSLDTILKDAGL